MNMAKPVEWLLYVPNDGHWPIPGMWATKSGALVAAKGMWNRYWKTKTLPTGSFLCKKG